MRAAAVRAMVQMIEMDEEGARKEELGVVAAKAVVARDEGWVVTELGE